MKRCNRCVLPECTPDINFDKEGVCNFCHTYHNIVYAGKSELLKLLDSHRRKGSKYDCIITLSGGRDSTYTLLKVVKDYHMKVLAVNYENPFTDSQAKANIENAIEALNIDIVRIKLKNRMHERTLRNNVIAWFEKPSLGAIPMMCVACKNMWWEIMRIAQKYDIHCIVSGGNRLEHTSFKKSSLGLSVDESAEKMWVKSISGILRETFKNFAYVKPQFIPTMMKAYFFGDPYSIGYKLLARHLSMIDLFFYIRWDEQEVISRIKSELNWDYPTKFDSSWRFDCRVGHLKDFMYMKIIGMTEKDDFYAKMVRECLMTRDYAILRLQKENKLHLDEVRQLLNDVGIEDVSSFLK